MTDKKKPTRRRLADNQKVKRKFKYDYTITVKLTEDQRNRMVRAMLVDAACANLSDFVRRWANSLPGEVVVVPAIAPLPAAVQPTPQQLPAAVRVTRDRCSPFAPCGLDGCDRNCARCFLQPDQM